MSAAAVAAGLAAVKREIATAARRAARLPGEVTLVAVSKGHEEAAAKAALAAGHRVFGENRVQEAQAKWPPLKRAFAGIRLHLVGPLQTNKAAAAVALFDAIESVDRPRLVAALARQMQAQGRRPACFVQVNTGEEPQKAGAAPDEADALIGEARRAGLPVVGLMAIPPAGEEPSLHFALLASIAQRNRLACLSMGMSADYATAVAFGATHVRVGQAVFGPRPAAGPAP